MHKKKALLTGHILISAHPSAEYCLSGRVVVSLLQAFTPLLRPLTVFLLTFLCTVHTIWIPYIGKVMLVRLFCSKHELKWCEIKTSFFSVNGSKQKYVWSNEFMKIIYENCRVKNYMKENHRSYKHNFCSCVKKACSCVYNCDDLQAHIKVCIPRIQSFLK